jgi:phage repressor protein C with HTH and peptisase S24 domain
MDKSLILEGIQEAYGFEKKNHFAKFLGIKPSTISSWFSRNMFDYDLLYNKLEGLNPEFLLTGKGSIKIKNRNVIKVPADYNNPMEENMVMNEKHVFARVSNLKIDRQVTQQSIPLLDIEAVAGIVPTVESIQELTPLSYISIPNLPKCDAAVTIVGDSMYPLLKSGDVVMFKIVNDFINDLFWGEMYLISLQSNGDDYIVVKFIQKSDLGPDYIKLVSQNKHHQDKDLKISKIRSLGLIKASIRINSMS